MALSIKNREVEALARELARLTSKPITEAVRDSLKREVERARVIASATPKDDDFVERIMAIGRKVAAMPDISTLSDDEILGYDEHGAPTR
ncbi:MAG: type II toxin-antitoxin system VapB family antitoxin [Rhizobiales bacterium]|nr:type II toxin-antitoxin system VapB family antitoxin [Hyphomicrobiales bacterium]